MKKDFFIASVIIAVTGLAFVSFSGSVFSGYHFMDCSDYYILERGLSEMSWFDCFIKHINNELESRFRPAWHLNVFTKTLLFGNNMLLHSFWQIFLKKEQHWTKLLKE